MPQHIRINPITHKKLKELAEVHGVSMQVLIDEAVDSLTRKKFWEEFDAYYEKAGKNSQTTKEDQEERKIWDITLLDGLDND